METVICAKQLRKEYYVGKQVCVAVKNISMEIKKGQMIAIIGPSGCGKTTLINMLGGLISATSGEIFIQGKRWSKYSEKEKASIRNSYVSYIVQSFALIDEESVIYNLEVPLLLGKKPIRKKERSVLIDSALKQVGLLEKRKEKVKNLSGGQQQRVAIARILVQNAQIIFGDEPTGALDKKMGDEVFLLLKELVRKYGKTLILVTHNEELAKQCDIIYRMEDGEIVEKIDRNND